MFKKADMFYTKIIHLPKEGVFLDHEKENDFN